MRPETEARFLAKIRKTETCWQWTAATQSRGYGCFGLEGRVVLAHRVAYELFIGPIPEGLTIDHTCRNKLCVRPDHLQAITNALNNRRRGLAARSTPNYPCGHPRDEGNTLVKTRGGRECRTCDRNRTRSRRELVSA